MPNVTFHATPAMPSWTHRKGGFKPYQWEDGRSGMQLVEPVVMRDGDTIEMDDFDAQWATTMYPDNFVVES